MLYTPCNLTQSLQQPTNALNKINTYVMYIKDPYICFDNTLSSSGGSSQGIKEYYINLHFQKITFKDQNIQKP
jgi:hypothetical protein